MQPSNAEEEEEEEEGGNYRSSHSCSLFVGWLFNVLATYECILGTDLLRQFYVLPH